MDRQEHLKEEELAFYVDALRLHRMDALPGDLLKHVEICFECQKAIMEISSLIPDEVYTEGDPHPFLDRYRDGGRSTPKPFFTLRMAAGILLVLGAGAVLYFASVQRSVLNSGGETAKIQGADTTRGKSHSAAHEGRMMLAQGDRFMPLPALERLAGKEFRSGSSLNTQFVRPSNGDTIPSNQVFSWDGDKSDKPYEFVIVTNHGQDAVRTTIVPHSYQLKQPLVDGLYYWKLEQAGELVLVRKFFIVTSPPTFP